LWLSARIAAYSRAQPMADSLRLNLARFREHKVGTVDDTATPMKMDRTQIIARQADLQHVDVPRRRKPAWKDGKNTDRKGATLRRADPLQRRAFPLLDGNQGLYREHAYPVDSTSF